MVTMKALVTGATGFLGGNLIRRLLEEGYEVTAVGRNPEAGKRLTQEGAGFVRMDLASDDMPEAVRGHELVFHCGAMSSPWGAYRDFYTSNVVGTRQIIRGCMKHGVRRLVNVSTPSIYFDYRDRLGISEEEPLPGRGVNAYAQTKRQAESELDAAHKAGLPVITIRPRGLFGPGDTAIFPRLLRANEEKFVPIFGGGRAFMDVTYVDNVTEALLCCARADKACDGQKYNITNGEPVYVYELLAELFRLLEVPFRARKVPYPAAYGAAAAMEAFAALPFARKEPMLTRYTVALLAFSQTLDISKAERELGYKPRISVAEGIRRFSLWWREQEGRA
ncbi:NAD-dependent epimerase/dehydratase family protein [Paenibacillus chitinolyticus]|uniref:NAD-dependent epimerase/dehydratase family protein n=1 Tax=Paenibacillus chitinolyticus TaxID=79263 RepID=UPI0036DCFF92